MKEWKCAFVCLLLNLPGKNSANRGKFYAWDIIGCMGETLTPVWVRYLNSCGREDGVQQNCFVLNSNGPPCLIWNKIGWKCFKLSAFCVTQPSPEGAYFRIFRSFRCFRNHKRHKNDWWTSFPLTRWVSIIAFQREIICAGRTKYYALGAWNDTRTVRTYRHRIAELKIDIYIDVRLTFRLTIIHVK